MATPANVRVEAIEKRLDAIEASFELVRKKPSGPIEQFRMQLWQWIKTHKTVIFSIAGIVVSVSGWFGSGLFKYWLDHRDDGFNLAVDGRVKAALKESGGVSETLHQVKEIVERTENKLDILLPFINDVINRQFIDVSNLSAHEFQDRLPAVSHLLAVARIQNYHASESATENLRSKLLRANSTSPGYWPVTSEFISYRSIGTGTSITAPCREPASIGAVPLTEHFDPNGPVAGFIVYRDCTMDIGDVAVFENGPVGRAIASTNSHFHTNSLYGFMFVNVHVVYRGGSLIPATSYTFSKCTFDFALNAPPLNRGNSLTQALLASRDISAVKVKFTEDKG
jgi:hypothetical protein